MASNSESKNALISGGARGIGRCLARTFLTKGHRVYLFDIDEEQLKHTTVHLKKYHGSSKLDSSLCNLRDIADIRHKVSKAAEFNNRIDVLINNAYIETNLTAPFAMSQACIPYMKASRGVADAGHPELVGIRVNLIAPGRIGVAHESREGDKMGKDWQGMPEDIADAMYLMNAGFVTGQDIAVDGGVLKKKK
ncbi:NAD(P)-binding protein [Cenococcum geophilum 1.58]|uniref:NAD(P)-binding protein n=1 Tax=Cenococcum geophilum 1.58 TaxID=794803 RepID=UPI00358E44C7|nr:NAD(P)-binding protein [Cenococcum geophilum 1.58]